MADPTVPPAPPLRQTPQGAAAEFQGLMLQILATQKGISEDVARQVKEHVAITSRYLRA